MRRAGVLLALALALGLALSCRARQEPAAPAAADPQPAAAVPVRTARASVATLARTVDAPGHTVALVQQKVRAPFAGTLATLTVSDGDRVRRGAVLGSLLSRDSEAALAGAREMEREAKTPAEAEDARRALALAERNLVHASLRAPVDGVVLGHAAASGDRVTEDQEILTLAEASALAFVADVPQSALAQIRPGQKASIALAGRPQPVAGAVHDVMPVANAVDFTAPVRIDLPSGGAPFSIGLFGNVRIVVAEKANAVVVPSAALLRDDVTGKSRLALVQDGRARWHEAAIGLAGSEGTEILSPPLAPGDVVIVGGQVGLPEGAAVTAGAQP